jgi:hypothetical protein
MRTRALLEHTYSLRAEEVHNILQRAELSERDSMQTPGIDSVLTDQVAR